MSGANSTISPGFPKHEFRNTLYSSVSESLCSVGHTKHRWSNRALLFSFNLSLFMGFSGGWDGKEPACNAGDLSLIPGLGRSPGGGHGHPLQYYFLENPYGQRSLAGYSHEVAESEAHLSTAHHCLHGSYRPPLVAQWVKNLPCNAGATGDTDMIPEPGRPPGGGNGSPLHCSRLENPMDRRAWRATVHGVTKSWTWVKHIPTHMMIT